MISHHQQVKISWLYFMDDPFGDRLKNVNKTLHALVWNASEVHGPQRMNPGDFTIPWHDPAQPTSPSFTLNMSTSTSCIDKKTLQTFRVPRWWNLMTNFSSAVTAGWTFWFIMMDWSMDCRERDQTFAVPIGWIAINLQILLHFILRRQTLRWLSTLACNHFIVVSTLACWHQHFDSFRDKNEFSKG